MTPQWRFTPDSPGRPVLSEAQRRGPDDAPWLRVPGRNDGLGKGARGGMPHARPCTRAGTKCVSSAWGRPSRRNKYAKKTCVLASGVITATVLVVSGFGRPEDAGSPAGCAS